MDRIKASELASPRFKANPYPLYARLRRESPVCRTALFHRPAWLVTRYDDVLLVLKDERFAKDWTPQFPWVPRFVRSLTRSMLNLDPPDHTRIRKLVNKAFVPRLIEGLRQRIASACDDLLNVAELGGQMELVCDYALPLPLAIVSELLGIPAKDRLWLHARSRSLVEGFDFSDLFRALPDMWRVSRYLRRMFDQRRAQPREDLVTALVQAEEASDKLSEDELLSMMALLLLAGYETTVNLIANGTLALLQHPEQRERLRQNSALVDSAIEELLRYTSPADIATVRMAREEVTFGSVIIPRDDLVLAALGSANYDESQFADPETLDLAREPNRHLTFGQGAHFCLGAPLARLEGQIALTTLFRRFPNLHLAVAPESLRWRRALFFRGLEELPVAC